MKFSCSVDIDLSHQKTVELWNNPENLVKWQDGFVSFEHISGTPGTPGAKSRMKYKSGKREIELIETIQVNNLPDEFTGHYEAREMTNTMANTFTETAEGKTRYEANVEYIKFNGFMPRLMAFLMPGLFKKQVQKWLNQFKAFAESEAEKEGKNGI